MKHPWYKKINPLWWFGNANDPVQDHLNFYPDKPLWIRKLKWGIRNPLHNFFFFVIGLEDRREIVNRTNMWPSEGQTWNVILPFISHKGKKYEWYLGWRNGLTLGAAFRKVNSIAK